MNYGGRAFYEERTPGSDNFDLVVRDKAGKRKIVDVAALRASNGGKPHAINYFLASPDGSKVAAGISQGGSEAASIFVYDAATGKQIAGPLDRADPGYSSWSNDSSTLYFARLKKLAPGEADIEKYRNPTLVSWDLKSEPVAVLGSTVGHGPSFLPDELPTLSISPGAPMAMAVSINGVQNELALWLAPVSQLNDPNVKWTPFVTRADDVTAVDAAGDTIYLLSHKNAPTFQVLSVKAGQPLAAASDSGAGGKRSRDRCHPRRVGRALCAGASRRLFAAAARSACCRKDRRGRPALQGPHPGSLYRSAPAGHHDRPCKALSSRPRPSPTIRRRRPLPISSSA